MRWQTASRLAAAVVTAFALLALRGSAVRADCVAPYAPTPAPSASPSPTPLPTAWCVEVVSVAGQGQSDVQMIWTAIGIGSAVVAGGVFVLIGRSVAGR